MLHELQTLIVDRNSIEKPSLSKNLVAGEASPQRTDGNA